MGKKKNPTEFELNCKQPVSQFKQPLVKNTSLSKYTFHYYNPFITSLLIIESFFFITALSLVLLHLIIVAFFIAALCIDTLFIIIIILVFSILLWLLAESAVDVEYIDCISGER